MNPLKKEFLELFRASGWSQAEVARKLEMTRAGVNGIVKGDTVPSLATVKLLKLILLSEKPEALGGKMGLAEETLMQLKEGAGFGKNAEPWAAELLEELRDVDEETRESLLEAFRKIVRTYPKKR